MNCPRCGCRIIGYPALSRKDNQTDICSECGVQEAMEDFTGVKYTGKKYWIGEEQSRMTVLDATNNKCKRRKKNG